MQKRLDVIHAFAEDDKTKFQDYLKEKGLEFNKSKEELTEEFQNRLQAARDRVDHRSQKMRKHATRILSRNPGSVSFKHKAEFESIKERINELRKTK